jgi:putative transposase
MYAAVIRAAERWRGLRMSEFELRQLKAMRDELNRDFTARVAPVTAPHTTASQARLSSKNRT